MRDILFRGYNKKIGWVLGVPLILGDDLYILDNDLHCFPDLNDGMHVKIIPDTIGQYSGFEDIKGKKIFEGDIVTWKDSDINTRKNAVKWVYGGLCLCNAQYTIGAYVGCEMEVIGNIHDNPELLEVKK